MSKNDWNPDLYLKFDKERIQPSIDLVSRINFENPESIIDIGCGPGNSTQILTQRWPNAKITGIDNSPAMIEKARSYYPDQDWKVMDARDISLEDKYDIVFSNATIQWIPDHKKILNNLKCLLTNNGIMAIQMPLFKDMPIAKSLERISQYEKWKSLVSDVKDLLIIHDFNYYYDTLSEIFSSVDMWITHYVHVLEGHQAIFEMMKSTGIKPYIERLGSEDYITEFSEQVLDAIKKDYPLQENGKVLYPFKRLFWIAKS